MAEVLTASSSSSSSSSSPGASSSPLVKINAEAQATSTSCAATAAAAAACVPLGVANSSPSPGKPAPCDETIVVGLDGAGSSTSLSLLDPVLSQEVILAAQTAFECPDGWKRSVIPPPSASKSLMYSFGVKTEEDVPRQSSSGKGRNKNERRPNGRWYCMATETCTRAKTFLKLSRGSSSSATDHLRFLHSLSSKRSAEISKRRSDMSRLRDSNAFNNDKHRFVMMHYTKTHTILSFQPFSFMENAERRNTLELMTPTDHAFNIDKLNGKEGKRAVVEMYHATKMAFVRELAKEVASSPIRILHVNIDIWTAATPVHKDRYMGIRVFLLTQEFQVKTFLLAVKQFKPASECTPAETGTLVQLWAEHVLEEFGLNWTMIASVVINRGHDIEFAFSDIPGVMREWCIPGIINRAIIDAFGLSLSLGASKNPRARKVIAEVRTVMENVNASETAKVTLEATPEDKNGFIPKAGLRQAVSHRWVSGAALLERFLVSYDDLVLHYENSEDDPVFMNSKQEVRETYSILKSLSLVIEGSQSTKTISSSTSMQSMIVLLTADLNVNKSLLLHDPAHYFSEPVATGEETPAKKTRTRKDHAELSRTAQETRAKAYDAVFKRFGRRRWGKRYKQESHLFDMVLALNPSCRSLGYVDKLSTTKVVVDPIKNKVWSQLESLVEEVIVVERAAASPVKSRGGGREQRPQKRSKIASKWDKEQLEEIAGSGMFDAPLDGDGEDDGGTDASAREEASIVIRTWREAKIPFQYRAINDGEELGTFWRGYGRQKFRMLSKVARSVLGAPTSSAVLEREFGEAGKLMNCQRGSLGPAYVEMVMFLRGVYDYIPEIIPKLGDDEAEEAIPFRLRDPTVRKELAGLLVQSPLAGGDGAGLGLALANTDDERELSWEHDDTPDSGEEDDCCQ